MFGLTFTFFSTLTQCYSQTVVVRSQQYAGLDPKMHIDKTAKCSFFAQRYIKLNRSHYPVSGVFKDKSRHTFGTLPTLYHLI